MENEIYRVSIEEEKLARLMGIFAPQKEPTDAQRKEAGRRVTCCTIFKRSAYWMELERIIADEVYKELLLEVKKQQDETRKLLREIKQHRVPRTKKTARKRAGWTKRPKKKNQPKDLLNYPHKQLTLFDF